MKTLTFTLLFFISTLPLYAQLDSIKSRFSYNLDFRFRLEQDWNSRKSDGTFRDDRTRLRYRLRAGVVYKHNQWASIGAQLRTGDQRKQQDPQLTLGDGLKEFGTLPIGFEKIYFRAQWNQFDIWAGKNTYPFKKNNELFWSDNVYPEGVSVSKAFNPESNIIDLVELQGGHFIINARGENFGRDSHFEGAQIYSSFFDKRLQIFPSFYLFRNIQNIPDGAETFLFDYSIFHIGSSLNLTKKPLINLEFDYYHNLENYDQNDSIPTNLRDERRGVIVALAYGKLKHARDLAFKATFAYLERYAAVDFLAQNDWARWDYSSFDSPDGRLTNLRGIEFVTSYLVAEKIKLTMKYYVVEQLIPTGLTRENGNRIRFDIDIKF